MINRREVLMAGAATLAAPALLKIGSEATKGGFRVIHMTDLHMGGKERAREGIDLAVAKVRSLSPRPDFIIVGGDACNGLMASSDAVAREQLSALSEAFGPLEMPVHWVVGNHDVIGWGRQGSSQISDAAYGKALFADRFIKGPTYRAFNHKGWRFILLDSIQKASPGSGQPYLSLIDDHQLAWLKSEVANLKGVPAVVVTHSPLLTGYFIYNEGPYVSPQFRMVLENAKEVHELLKKSSVKVVLQGHTHVRENLIYAGRQHITSGAVCGSWWNGPRFGIDPEGFSILDFDSAEAKWAYLETGFKADQ